MEVLLRNNETVLAAPDLDCAPIRSRSFEHLKYFRKSFNTMQRFGNIYFLIRMN
jgi:hypothetical protein